MKIVKYTILAIVLLVGASFAWMYYSDISSAPTNALPGFSTTKESPSDTKPKTEFVAKPQVTPQSIAIPTPPTVKLLPNSYHIFQTFNNCGPAALSMALSYYDISVTQKELGDILRPYQNPQGIDDDKSVSMQELAEQAKDYGFNTYYRPNGNIDLITNFIALDIPVITKTLLSTKEDIGHYRVVKGYNSSTQMLTQDDSLQGANLTFTYGEFNALWEPFGFEYLILVPKDKTAMVEQLLGANLDQKVAWQNAVKNYTSKTITNPADVNNRFNLSVALYNVGNYQQAVSEFEKVENKLSARALWYQIEPIKAYYQLGKYDRVIEISNKILENGNRAFSELYIILGGIYTKQNKIELANEQYALARRYNKNIVITPNTQ